MFETYYWITGIFASAARYVAFSCAEPGVGTIRSNTVIGTLLLICSTNLPVSIRSESDHGDNLSKYAELDEIPLTICSWTANANRCDVRHDVICNRLVDDGGRSAASPKGTIL